MLRWVQLLHLADRSAAALEAVRLELEQAAHTSLMVQRSLCAPALEGSFNAGDLIWHLQFADAAAQRACTAQAHWRERIEPLLADRRRIVRVDGALYESGRGGARRPDLRQGIYRVALFAVDEHAPAAAVEACEADLLTMPEHLPTMLNWTLSRASSAAGSRRWTHVWEQEYAEAKALLVDYMIHPVHWGYVDRWFDPECPERIVDPVLCHGFCALPSSIVA